MSLLYIDELESKNVFVTEYCAKVLFQRSLSSADVLQVLADRKKFPVVVDGNQSRIKAVLGGKKVFINLFEDSKRIIVITGGLWEQKIKEKS